MPSLPPSAISCNVPLRFNITCLRGKTMKICIYTSLFLTVKGASAILLFFVLKLEMASEAENLAYVQMFFRFVRLFK